MISLGVVDMINVIFNDFDYEIMPKRYETFEKYCKVLQWGRRHPTRFAEQFFNLQLTDHQKWLFLSSWLPSTNVWLCSRATGKLESLNTIVFKVSRDDFGEKKENKYSSKMIKLQDLKNGDWIYNENCEPVEVIQLHPIIFTENYKVYFDDGEIIECGGTHEWLVLQDDELKVVETDFIKDNIKNNKFYVPIPKWNEQFSKDYPDIIQDKRVYKEILKVEKEKEKIPMRCITVNSETGLYLCGEHATVTHNSYMASIFLMLKSILFPHYNCFIMAPSGDQAKATFAKLENLAKNNIASAVGVTRVFLDECVRPNSKADPFSHNANGHEVSLYNGSKIVTLNSVAKNIVGYRSNLSIYDEAGEMFARIPLNAGKSLELINIIIRLGNQQLNLEEREIQRLS